MGDIRVRSNSGLESIVHDCMESTAQEVGMPKAVLTRLIGLADDVASGQADPTAKSEFHRRIEVIIKGYDVVEGSLLYYREILSPPDSRIASPEVDKS